MMLTLIETTDQVRWLDQHPENPAAGGELLALTPTAAFACQQLSKKYLKLEDRAHVSKRLGEYVSALADYVEWEAWLDGWAQHTVPEFGASGFRPARDVTFLLQLLHAEIWSAVVSMGEFLDATRPSRVAFWQPQILDVPWYLHPSVYALPALLPSIARSRGIGVADLSCEAPGLEAVSKAGAPPGWVKRIGKWARQEWRASPVYSEWMAIRSGGRGYFQHLHRETPRILISGTAYDIVFVANELRRQGIRIAQIPDELPPPRLFSSPARVSSEFDSALVAAGERLFQEPDLWRPLDRLKLDHVSLWSKPLYFWWHRLVPELWLRFQAVRKTLERGGYSAMLTWDTTGSSLSSAAANAAGTLAIPRFVYQHGGSSGNDAKIWQMSLRQCDGLLLYGQGTADELRESVPTYLESSARLVPVGSARLDRIRLQHRPKTARKLRDKLRGGDNRPIILYVPTVFGTYGRSISDLAGYPEVSYFELQQSILKLWLEAPGVRLLYKDLIVANDPNRVMPDFIRQKIPNGMVTYHPLTQLMRAVDAIVVDHAITALGEVLLTQKPLVVYLPKPNAAGPDAVRLLKKRAVIAETSDEFQAAVRLLLKAGRYPEVENPNTEFLEKYCTHLNDGYSAKRAASALLAGVR